MKYFCDTHPIRSVAVGMIATAIFKAIVGDIAGERFGVVANEGVVAIGGIEIAPVVVVVVVVVEFVVMGGHVEEGRSGR